MKNIILAIDDSPERYVLLPRSLPGYIIVVMHNPTAVRLLLASGQVACIFLDHDMPCIEPESNCIVDNYNGLWFIRNVIPYNIPVCIVSANPVGAGNMLRELSGVERDVCCISVTTPSREKHWAHFVNQVTTAK